MSGAAAMKPKVYVETTVISYLAAWPSRDLVMAAHQQVTREWWTTAADRFELVASEHVAGEAKGGDPDAAARRLAILAKLPLLRGSPEAEKLAAQFVAQGAMHPSSAADAMHLALAVTNGIDYLVTWNCRHLANAELRETIEEICRSEGYRATQICTPEELSGGSP